MPKWKRTQKNEILQSTCVALEILRLHQNFLRPKIFYNILLQCLSTLLLYQILLCTYGDILTESHVINFHTQMSSCMCTSIKLSYISLLLPLQNSFKTPKLRFQVDFHLQSVLFVEKLDTQQEAVLTTQKDFTQMVRFTRYFT